MATTASIVGHHSVGITAAPHPHGKGVGGARVNPILDGATTRCAGEGCPRAWLHLRLILQPSLNSKWWVIFEHNRDGAGQCAKPTARLVLSLPRG